MVLKLRHSKVFLSSADLLKRPHREAQFNVLRATSKLRNETRVGIRSLNSQSFQNNASANQRQNTSLIIVPKMEASALARKVASSMVSSISSEMT